MISGTRSFSNSAFFIVCLPPSIHFSLVPFLEILLYRSCFEIRALSSEPDKLRKPSVHQCVGRLIFSHFRLRRSISFLILFLVAASLNAACYFHMYIWYTLFFYKRQVYMRLSLDFRQKSRTNWEQAQDEFQLTLIFKKILNEFFFIKKNLKIIVKTVF